MKERRGTGVRTFRDPLGGVFRPMPGATRVAWAYGDGPAKEAMFSCPVSAIPPVVFDLLELWHDCRTLRTLPLAGGFLDQPLLVRRAFPIFEREQQRLERAAAAQGAAGATLAQLLAAGATPAPAGRTPRRR